MLIEAKETKLANGIRVVTANLPGVQSVSTGIWVGVGSRHETAAVGGVSHFIEHLLFKGTAKRSAHNISRTIEGCGGYVNAFTQEEMTCYYVRAAYNHARKVSGILCDMFLNARFNEADIEKERKVIIEEIMMYRDQPDQVVQELLDSILWKNHQIGRPIIGTPESIRKMSRHDIVKFKTEKYSAQTTVVVMAGKVRHDEVVQWMDRFLGAAPVARKPKAMPVTAAVKQETIALRNKEIEQTQLAMAFRTFGFFDKNKYALTVLNVILGGNMSSKLFRAVREKNGLAYSIHSRINLFSDTGCLVISAGLDKNNYHKALALIGREISRLKCEPVSEAELARAKEYVVGHLRMSLESPAGQMMWMGSNMMSYGTVVSAEEVIETVHALSPADVLAVAKSVFMPESASLALLSSRLSESDEERIRSALNSF